MGRTLTGNEGSASGAGDEAQDPCGEGVVFVGTKRSRCREQEPSAAQEPAELMPPGLGDNGLGRSGSQADVDRKLGSVHSGGSRRGAPQPGHRRLVGTQRPSRVDATSHVSPPQWPQCTVTAGRSCPETPGRGQVRTLNPTFSPGQGGAKGHESGSGGGRRDSKGQLLAFTGSPRLCP